MARAYQPAYAYQPELADADVDWWRTEMWAYVHLSLPDDFVAKKAFFSQDKDDLLAFVKDYVHEDFTLNEGVSEDQFVEGLDTDGYDLDAQDCHLVKQVTVHSSDKDFRGPLMMLYWHGDIEHIVKCAEIHAFADANVIKEWSFEELKCPFNVREKLVAAAEKNESLCFPPRAGNGVFTDGACLVCDCPILCQEDGREGDELSLLLNDMTSVDHRDGGVPGMEQQLFLEPSRADMWKVYWKPDLSFEIEFEAKDKYAAEKYRDGIFKKQTKQLQSYRMIKGIMQRFDRIEQAIEQLTGEMRFLPPAHGGAEYWKTSRRFRKGYRSE